MPKTIILIGGAPTSGKSTVAAALSARLGLPWISTDQIRTVMRSSTTPDLSPDLFNPVNDPEVFLTRYSAEEIARMEWAQGEAAWPGIRAFVRHSHDWRDGCVVE
jgi:2-phosphoglycerate kinase